MMEIEPASQEELQSSMLLICGRQFNMTEGRRITINNQFIILPIDTGGAENLLLSLSFKHITKIEFLDNSEHKGAGIIVHINDFMFGKLQQYLDKDNNTKLGGFKCLYSETKFILFDIINFDAGELTQIRKLLHEAYLFHHSYMVKLMNNRKRQRIDVPMGYIAIITYAQWETCLSMLGSSQQRIAIIQPHQQITLRPVLSNFSMALPTPTQSNINLLTPSQSESEPRIHIVFPQPHRSQSNQNGIGSRNIYCQENRSVQPFSSNITINPAPSPSGFTRMVGGEMTVNEYLRNMPTTTTTKDMPTATTKASSAVSSKRHTTSAINTMMNSSLPTIDITTIETTKATTTSSAAANKLSRSLSLKTPTPKQKQGPKKQIQEIHLIDDDEEEECKAEEAINSSAPKGKLFSYPPKSQEVSVFHSDLKHLALDVMLNDTIIDFYLQYIKRELVPKERRDKIYIFNTFFFSRLTQAPAHGKPQVALPTKIKRVITNFQAQIKNWTKKVDLFEKDYIVVPINEDIHWYLAIIVNPRAAIYSNAHKRPIVMDSAPMADNAKAIFPKPYIVVFNSLIDPALDKHLEVRSQLAEYLWLEYRDKHPDIDGIDGTTLMKDVIEVIQPVLIPQQKGYIDCGLFLLQFAELFLTNPPKKISNNVMFHRWYKDFQIRQKRDEIKDVIRRLAPNAKPSDFIYYPPPNNTNNNKNKRPKRQQQKSILDAIPLLRRDRTQSESRLDEIAKDPRFSVLYRPRSLDSLILENKEKPLVLQPPTILEMKRFKKTKRPLIDKIA